MQKFAFYHRHLEQVSRSFNFCIAALSSPSKEWVALSYLLLRIVDTIEDSNWVDSKKQSESFEVFKLFLINQPSEQLFLAWARTIPEQINESEKNLIMDLPILLGDLNQLPNEIQNEITTIIVQVVDGMKHFLNEYKEGDILKLPSTVILNQYCFFVAGIVGQLLSRIFTHQLDGFNWTTPLLNNGIHFGLFLQKINLLKDKVNDAHSGRYYVSSREGVRESLVTNAQYALDYLKSIPIVNGRPYRLFCAWSLFIGLASLRWIDKNEQLQQDIYKIKTSETTYLIKQISQLIDDNHALEQLFNNYLPSKSNSKAHDFSYQKTAKVPEWFQSIYSDQPESIDWLGLGVVDLV